MSLDSYLWFGFFFVFVKEEMVRAQHKPAKLPILHDATLLLQPTSLQRPLLEAGGSWPAWASRHLAHHHALGPGCKCTQTHKAFINATYIKAEQKHLGRLTELVVLLYCLYFLTILGLLSFHFLLERSLSYPYLYVPYTHNTHMVLWALES